MIIIYSQNKVPVRLTMEIREETSMSLRDTKENETFMPLRGTKEE